MVMAVGAVDGNRHIDYEHMRIIQELYKLGIKPTGIKELDKARLKIEKEKIIKQIKQKAENLQSADNIQQTDKSAYTNEKESIERAQMEEERLGAKSVGELNKILHGLK